MKVRAVHTARLRHPAAAGLTGPGLTCLGSALAWMHRSPVSS